MERRTSKKAGKIEKNGPRKTTGTQTTMTIGVTRLNKVTMKRSWRLANMKLLKMSDCHDQVLVTG